MAFRTLFQFKGRGRCFRYDASRNEFNRRPRAEATPGLRWLKRTAKSRFQSAAPAPGLSRTSLAKAHRGIAVSIRAPGAEATNTNYSGYGTDCAFEEKAVSPVIGRREYCMSKPDGATEPGAKGPSREHAATVNS